MTKILEFPKNFLWGTSTAAHQVEGDNTNSDWWHWENRTKKKKDQYPLEPSLKGCDSYNRYEEDFDIAVEYGSNSIRFSVEWARIEPRQGEFSYEEIEHYRKVINAAKSRGLKTFVTLHHFTNPKWFSDMGGWHNLRAPWMFERYVKKCMESFGKEIDFIQTINEPQVYALMAYTNGMWPPNKINPFLSLTVQIIFMLSHIRAYNAIKKIFPKKEVGFAKNIVWYDIDPDQSTILDRIAASVLNFMNCGFFIKPLMGHLDFIGLNYYFTNRISHLNFRNADDWKSDLNWWIYPKGLEYVLMELGKFKLPIYITENGIADAKDINRERFIKEMLISCHTAISRGVDLRGYMHWSLIDNYEWHQGYWPRFGLVEIDRENNMKRKPRKSFNYYARICRENNLSIE